jgi:hypothetical protein
MMNHHWDGIRATTPNVHLSSFNGIPMRDRKETEYPPNALSAIKVPARRAHPLLIASQSNNRERASKTGKPPPCGLGASTRVHMLSVCMTDDARSHDFLLATSIVPKQILMRTSAAHVPFLLGEFRLAPRSFLLNVLGIRQTLFVWVRPQDASRSIPATPNSEPGEEFESIKSCPIRRLVWVFQATKQITGVLTPPIPFYR